MVPVVGVFLYVPIFISPINPIGFVAVSPYVVVRVGRIVVIVTVNIVTVGIVIFPASVLIVTVDVHRP